ncbi:MAG: hypothetical protein QM765_30865 [Myxococcales bacterium]
MEVGSGNCIVLSTAFALALAGCTSGGSTVDTSKAVDVRSLYGAEVQPCAAGHAHPNVCCLGAPYKATVCSEDLAHPFDACDPGAMAYPDPEACCALDGERPCLQPAGVDPAAVRGNCVNPCRPGGYPDPSMPALYCWFGIGLSMQLKDPGIPISWCSDPCPAGWSAPEGGQLDLCCKKGTNSQELCFSQANAIESPGGASSGRSSPAECKFEVFAADGKSRVIRCDFTVSRDCDCLVNGAVTKTVSLADGHTCLELPDVCGFL